MDRNKILFTAILTSALLVGCSTDEQLPILPDADHEVRFSAMLQEMKGVSRAVEPISGKVTPTTDEPYYLYYISSSAATVPKVYTTDFTTSSSVYWDDVEPDAKTDEADKEKATFQLTNVAKDGMYPVNSKDIQWGEATGWNSEPVEPLTFKLKHKMSQLSLVIIDQTNSGAGSVEPSDPIYKEVKAVISTLSKETQNFDIQTGVIVPTVREKEVELYSNQSGATKTEVGVGVEYQSTAAYFPPQTFFKKGKDGTNEEQRDSLRITCGKYTYTIEIPREMESADNEGTKPTTALREGEHLTLTILLKEETVDLKATLTDWVTTKANDMPLNRVFNISSLEELKDFALAVNTGCDFKGMVVRLTKGISFKDVTDRLHCFNIGTKSHPFRGIFDGGNQELKDLGVFGPANSYLGSLFGYTEGATLRNVKFATPFVKGQGALVSEAKNTVVIGCAINKGEVTGNNDDTGALIGKATGTTTLTNCYVTGTVVSANGKGNVGGLVGSTEGSITHCFATGDVTGGNNVGGLAGKVNGSVLNCYAWGSVTGISNIGGLVGTTQGSVNNSYAAGEVKLATGLSADRGGLLGSIGFGGIVKSCAWSKKALTPDDIKGAGVVDLSSSTTDSNEAFDFTSGSILTKLNTGNAGVWQEEGSAKRPTFSNL